MIRLHLGIDVLWGILGGFAALLFCQSLIGCPASEVAATGAYYDERLIECNQKAKDLCDSIKCENSLRASKGRTLRYVPKHCNGVEGNSSLKDAGLE